MDTDINDIFTKAKDLLKQEMTSISHDTWIKPLEILSMSENKIVLVCQDSFFRATVDAKYHDLITNTFNYLLNKKCVLEIISKDEQSDILEESIVSTPNLNYSNTNLQLIYNFENFVVGENNRFAHAASLAVAESPGTAYNPLFLYGGVGLGKTHLIYAIGNEVIKHNKSLRVLYVSSEQFTNEFINALKDASTEKFRQKYRNIDILLIDDIQFIAGKKQLQEEFFHTFNTLRENQKQIVLTSDRPPKEIPLLEERLKTRFEWGLLADVSMVDYETRLAILRKKADDSNLIVDDEILSNIAVKIDSNIRELEGVFNKLVAQSSLTHTSITMEMAEKAINDVIMKKESVISINYIQEVVCTYFKISMKDLTSSQRSNDIAFPRQIGMYLCRILTNESFPKIGESFGKRDHTTVMHAYKKIEKELRENKETQLIVESVKKIILNKKD